MTTSIHTPHPVAGVHRAADHGFLHSVETGGAVDGPGMRFVFFMAGCLFRCLYCHNPDTWKLHNGRRVDVDAMLSELKPYVGFLKFAGGVTFSGGEPLMQATFVGRVMERIKADLDLHIALDTQGFLHASLDDAWFDPVDLVLLDIKHIDPVRYERLTAQPLQPTLDFAERLVQLGKPTWIRYVLVPGLTDDADDVAKMADFVSGLGKIVERVEVLPFHQMGASKWSELNMSYELTDTPTPTNEDTEAARDIFRSRGLFTA
ncbi:pyruvate formate lyase activating enzyme [Breoghania corrubedonensis]|uniref:Pyruvate formate-lyase-activating enzyme n=1 Tax=Breoghania corrubedonensis TaxID=665038 RepID=A0A2T5USA1_9HYPH|nr:pyruvate formate-lyase-activating protein [Breoghania corrubedonensis]PTW54321.1 pyruvate formate lyase activating enzyme [Breoghania corrubedonensis]